MRVRLKEVPNAVRIGRELVNGIKRKRHGQENQSEREHLSRLLAVKVVQDNEENESINDNAHQFLAREVLDVSGKVSDDCVTGESQHRPANRWPEQAIFGVHPKTD